MNLASIKKIVNIQENVWLKDKTTIRVGGRARFYCQAETTEQLAEIVKFARQEKLNHIILGGGSNLIFSDKGYQGLVIKNQTSRIELQNDQVTADSGVFFERLIRFLAEEGWGGLEFLAGIPATVGGMIINNGGAFGWQIGDLLISCLILDYDNKEKLVSKDDLELEYRRSKYKGQTEGESFPVILRGTFAVKKSLPGVVIRKMTDIKKIRAKKTPAGFSAGCIFKNPKINQKELPQEWASQVRDGRISAGYLLDMAGAKNLRIGQAVVSSAHANFIINRSRASAKEIKELCQQMRRLVKDKYGISLEKEVEFIGDFKDQ